MNYCIECESFQETKTDRVLGEYHCNNVDVLLCGGPFAFSAPPEELPFWSWKLQVPSPDELAEMDAVASELMTEFV